MNEPSMKKELRDEHLSDDESLSLLVFPPVVGVQSPNHHNTKNNMIVGKNNAEQQEINKDNATMMMSQQPLHLYFAQLAYERKADCGNLTVVMDNARIPLGGEYFFLDDEKRTAEAFSSSLSAINTLSFPPPFLTHEDEEGSSRWDSIESRGRRRRPTSDTDLSIHKPARTCDDNKKEGDCDLMSIMDKTTHCRSPTSLLTKSPVPKKRVTRHHWSSPRSHWRNVSMKPTASLDSTARWLRELPPQAEDRSNRNRRRRRQALHRPIRSTDMNYEEMIAFSEELSKSEAEADEIVGEEGRSYATTPDAEDEALKIFSEMLAPSLDEKDLVFLLRKNEKGRKKKIVPTMRRLASSCRKTEVFEKSNVGGTTVLPRNNRAARPPPASLVNGFPFTTSPLATLRMSHDEMSLQSSASSSSEGKSPSGRNRFSFVLQNDAMERLIETTTNRLLLDS